MPETDQNQPPEGAQQTDPQSGQEAPPAGQSGEQPQQPPEGAQQPSQPPAPGKKARVRRQAQEIITNPATAETITTTVVNETEVEALPKRAKLAAPYAFYDDDGKLNAWAQGQELTDPDEIALLVDRGAIFEPDTE